MSRRLSLFAALVTIAAVGMAIMASNAFANGSIDWAPQKQGTSVVDGHRVLNSEQCDEANNGPFVGPNTSYLQWNFTGSSGVTAATLTINGADVTNFPGVFSDQTGNVIKFWTPFYDLDSLSAVVNYTG